MVPFKAKGAVPPKDRVPPATTLNDPPQVPPQVPPPLRVSVKPVAVTCTAPVLFTTILIAEVGVAVDEPDFFNVPALLNVPIGSVLCVMSLSFWKSQVEPTG